MSNTAHSPNTNIRVSVIVPVWNAEKTIERCLQSILDQSLLPDEIIIVDGGSTDSTISKAKSFLRTQDSIISEPDNGPYDAMNKGIKAARGKIISILNSDDFWMPETCKIISDLFDKSEESVGIVHGDLKYVEPDETFKTVKPTTGVLNYFCIGLPIAHPATFVRKSVYEKVGYYDYEQYPICADQDLAYRVADSGYELKYLPQTLSVMSAGGLSSTTNFSNEIALMLRSLKQPRKLFAKILRFLLGGRDHYYCSGYDEAWKKEILISVFTLGVFNSKPRIKKILRKLRS